MQLELVNQTRVDKMLGRSLTRRIIKPTHIVKLSEIYVMSDYVCLMMKYNLSVDIKKTLINLWVDLKIDIFFKGWYDHHNQPPLLIEFEFQIRKFFSRQRKRDQHLIDKNNVEIGIAFYSQNQFSIIGVFKLKIIRLMNHFGIIDNGFLSAIVSLWVFTKYFQASVKGGTCWCEEVDDLDQNDQITLSKETSSTKLFKGRWRTPR